VIVVLQAVAEAVVFVASLLAVCLLLWLLSPAGVPS